VASSGLHCREEERSMGGIQVNTWRNPPCSAELIPHGPWRTGEIILGAPVLLETLALYSHMTFENAKVAKKWKMGILFKLN